jgi:hypothetical protein
MNHFCGNRTEYSTPQRTETSGPHYNLISLNFASHLVDCFSVRPNAERVSKFTRASRQRRIAWRSAFSEWSTASAMSAPTDTTAEMSEVSSVRWFCTFSRVTSASGRPLASDTACAAARFALAEPSTGTRIRISDPFFCARRLWFSASCALEKLALACDTQLSSRASLISRQNSTLL